MVRIYIISQYFTFLEIPSFLTWMLNGINTANGAVYRDEHVADRHVPEAIMYPVPATCNNQ